jgi:hypothetical protein
MSCRVTDPVWLRVDDAVHESSVGTSRHFAAAQQYFGYRGIADSGKLSVQQIYEFKA